MKTNGFTNEKNYYDKENEEYNNHYKQQFYILSSQVIILRP